MFSNQSNYILPLCNTYILFCIGLQNWKIRYAVVINLSKNTTNRWGNDSLQNLKNVKPYCITKRQKCQCFSDRSFMCPKFKKNRKKYHSLNSCFWKRFLVHEVSSAFISSLVSWRIKYLHNSNISFKQERLFLLWRR